MALTKEEQKAKNARAGKTRAATKERRVTQQATTLELKLYPRTKTHKEVLRRVLLEAKWVYNHLLSTGEWESGDYKGSTVPVRLPDGTFEDRELLYLGSQVRQKIAERIRTSIKTLRTLKRQGHKVGRLKTKPEYNGLKFIQSGTTWRLRGSKVSLQGIPGWIRARGQHQLEGLELANAVLVSRPSGYYLKITAYRPLDDKPKELPEVGLDFGIATHLTASDGREWSSTVRETERLKRCQRKLARSKKGSNNREKTRLKLRREYEKMSRRKDDLASKIVSELKGSQHVYFQDEALNAWKRSYGKVVHYSILGRVKDRLRRLPSYTMLERWAPTTQWCPSCGARNKLPLRERVYSCPCGYSCPRDLHAARNMILLATLAGLSPGGPGGAPVDWHSIKPLSEAALGARVEAGNETTQKDETEPALPETRSSSVVA